MGSLLLRLVRLSLRLVLIVLLVLVLALAAVSLLRIPVPLTAVKAPIELIVQNLLERPVTIEDSIELKTSLYPRVTIKGLRIGNPEIFESDTFLFLGSAEFELELLPLLQGKIYLAKVMVDDVSVMLEQTADGYVNWGKSGADAEPEKEKAAPRPERDRLSEDALVIRELRLQNMSFFIHEPGSPKVDFDKLKARFRVAQCEGAMLPGKPAQLEMHGKLLGFPYSFEISLASLKEIIENEVTWAEFELVVAETVIKFWGEVSFAESLRELVLETSITGKRLDSLNALLQLDLPPFADYEVNGRLRLADGVFHLEDSLIRTGSSSLTGNLLVTKRGELYEVGVNLESPMVQLNDFIFANWSWIRDSATDVVEESKKQSLSGEKKEAATVLRRLTSEKLLENIDAFCVIQAQSVRSGMDELGRGILSLTIKGGRLALEPVQLNLPGGRITLQASIKPGVEGSDAALSAKISNFDIGVLARRKDPETTMGGLVNLDVDLQATASTMDTLLKRGSGHFDFSGQLKNIKAGAVDLWAVNLVTAMLTSTESSESQINCAVGRWTVRDGILTPDVLVVDTGKIRMCGSGKVDLANNSLKLFVQPIPKRAEFFNVATPVEIRGSFEDVKVGIAGGGILGSAVRFVTSPVFTPLKRIITEEIPSDGSDVCHMALGAASREDIRVRGCR